MQVVPCLQLKKMCNQRQSSWAQQSGEVGWAEGVEVQEKGNELLPVLSTRYSQHTMYLFEYNQNGHIVKI